MNAPLNRKYETDLMSCAAKTVVRKRRSSVEIKQQMKQARLFEQPNAIGAGDFTVGFDVMADSSVIDDMLSVGSFNCSFQTVGGLLMEHETPDILADSTTEEVLGFTCASDLLCHRDRGTFVGRQPDPTKPKVCRPRRRRKQELRVLRTPSETDGYDQSKFDEEAVTASSRSFDELACGEALVGEEVFWMETPESDELVLSLKDEDDITSMLFSPSGTSECLSQNLSWTSPPVQGLEPVPLNIAPSFGFENELTIADFDCAHNGKIPLQSTPDGASCNVHNIARWLSDCYGGCLSAADGKLESQMFCNLPGSEEVTNLECDPDSDFLDNLFSFPPCL